MIIIPLTYCIFLLYDDQDIEQKIEIFYIRLQVYTIQTYMK
jgi:hypothetical protein